MKDRIKALRKELRLTQQAFAERIGVKQNAIAQYEMGRNTPLPSIIALICREFGVSEEWLREGTGEMFAPAPSTVLDELAAEYHLSHGAYVAVEKFVNMRPEVQQEIINYFVEVAKALGDVPAGAPTYPVEDLSSLSIDERVELYRRELEREEKAGGESSASQGSA